MVIAIAFHCAASNSRKETLGYTKPYASTTRYEPRFKAKGS